MPSLFNQQDKNRHTSKESGTRPVFIILCLGIWLHATSSMFAVTSPR